ncbi:MAG: flavodoxin family protein [candidate division WS1 bacterium]|nr:flavodoxin family protein [candidate division WS1 bacterium]
MAKILVTYYSRTGNTAQMADLVAQAAASVEGAEVVTRPVEEITPQDLLAYDGLIMGSPVYYGLPAAELKKLLDDSVQFHGQLAGKVGGAFASSGGLAGGNETTILAILQMLLVHGMIVKGEASGDHYGPVAVGAPDGRSAGECEKLGRNVAALVVALFG